MLSVIGTDTYTLLRSLTAPRKPAELTYKELCDLLSSHFEPKPNAILQRYNFYSTYRKQGQSVKDFVAELKGLARNCDFGKTSTGVNLTEKLILEENLRDRLVCGVADTAIQRRLLGESDLSFDKAFQLALAMESAATNAAQLHTKDTTVYYADADKVSTRKQCSHKVKKGTPTHSQLKACFRCGKTTHLPSECRFRDTECRFCKKIGHIESHCFSKKYKPRNHTHHMRATGREENHGWMYSLYTVKGPRPDPIVTSLNVDGQMLQMEVDTGATLSVVSEETWRRHWTRPRPHLEHSHDTLRTNTGQCVKIKGIVDVKVEGKKGECHTLPLMVVPGNGPSLLGRNWLSMLQLDWTRFRSYLGMVNHYGRFVSNLPTVLAPLHQLLRKETRWRWSKAQQDAFAQTKEMLSTPQVMTHFDSSKPLVLTCDASPYGVGAVLAHAFDDRVERPIAYYSRSLSAAEKNYAQIDKEGLAVIAGLTKFHKYLWGRPFLIVTDHKPLLGLFGEQKAVPQMLSPRMQRWALTLAAYEYQIVHRPGSSIPQADALSRLPLGGAPTHVPVPGETILAMQYMDMSPVTSCDIRNETMRDAILSKVFMRARDGFPQLEDNDLLKPYHKRRTELSITDGCLMWGARVVIPSRYRNAMLEELHNAHSGIVRMKAVGRSFMWWPGIDSDIERTVNSCDICRRSRHKPTEAPLQPWSFPDRPWSRVHIDYAGPVIGKMILVVIDAHSKWIEAYTTSGSTSAITISKLKWIFSSHGIPDVIVSDNATGFVSEEFQSFCRRNGIKHVTSAPHHPATNGLAKRAVGILKGGVQRLQGDLETRIAHFLLDYRITPHTTIGVSPAELLTGRKLRTRLDRIIPDVSGRAISKQTTQKERHDQHTQARQYQPGDLVYALMYRGNKTNWSPGTVVTQTGPVSYTVRLEDGTIARRHIDQLQSRLSSSQVVRELPIYVEEPRQRTIEPEPSEAENRTSTPTENRTSTPTENRTSTPTAPSTPAPYRPAQPTDRTPPEPEFELRRSTRVRQQPKRFDL